MPGALPRRCMGTKILEHGCLTQDLEQPFAPRAISAHSVGTIDVPGAPPHLFAAAAATHPRPDPARDLEVEVAGLLGIARTGHAGIAAAERLAGEPSGYLGEFGS